MEEADFKFIVDMYHFREGGRPKPESEPKHVGVIKKFVTLVKYFKFLELDEIFYLKEVHGIEITVDNNEPNTPPLDTVKVPPVISSIVN